jgi:hypothetical protein
MRLKTRRLNVTTDASGDATTNDTLSIFGQLYAVETIDGDLADGVDLTLSVQSTESGTALTLLTLTDFNTDAMYYPRHLVHGETGTALTGTSGGDRALPVINGTLRAVVAQGGNAKTGGVIVYYISGR